VLSPVASERKLDNGRVILFVGIIVGVLFLRWINNHSANIYPVTVVSIVETLRDAIMARYSIEPEEFINR
jgi:small basic protein